MQSSLTTVPGGALPRHAAGKKRTQALQVLRSLGGPAHRLDELAERVELPAHEADDEVVVANVQPVAGETDIVRQVRLLVGPSQGGVLLNDRSLLLGRQPGKGTAPPERIPDRPRPGRIEHKAPRMAQQPVLENPA